MKMSETSVFTIDYARNHKWLKFTKQVKKERMYQCYFADKTCSTHLCCHHIKNVKDYPELVYEKDNILVLCQSHHRRLHSMLELNETVYGLKELNIMDYLDLSHFHKEMIKFLFCKKGR